MYYPKEFEKKFKKGFMKSREYREYLLEQEQEKIHEYLTKLIRYLNKKEENCYHDLDDPGYYGIRDMESLFSDVNVDDYYKPI